MCIGLTQVLNLVLLCFLSRGAWLRLRRRRSRKPHGMHRRVLCRYGFCWELFLTCPLLLRASRSPVRKGFFSRSFLRVCFGYGFGSENTAQRVPIGSHFGHIFRDFRGPVWGTHFCIDFYLIFGALGKGKSCVFYVRVVKNRCLAFPEKVANTTPQMTQFWYPLVTIWLTFGVPEN